MSLPAHRSVPDVPEAEIVELLSALVRIPSRAGEDAMEPIVTAMAAWYARQGLAVERLQDEAGRPLGLYAELEGLAAPSGPQRPWVVLNATLDTAGFGEPGTWRHAPTSAVVEDGRLYGRGSADSKAGAALFCHLLRHFSRRRERFAGRLGLLLDLDEHSGGFGGARRFFDAPARRPDGVLIGYPGCERIVVGARGFLRARVTVAGIAAHSGGSSQRGVNAVVRAARLVGELEALELARDSADTGFPRPAQLTVTALHGGSGFTQVPDRCELSLDVRLTPALDAEAARRAIEAVLRRHDAAWAAPASSVAWLPGWPAYRLPDAQPLVAALRDSGRAVLGRELPTAVAGPSNIGNYLAALGVPALCGFGVEGQNLHAADESVGLASIAPVFRIYAGALRRLLAG
ncbi:M20 family metallopeptidase [Azohydromonas caseinilytica]|uniref:M20 family metallopeptidase n=1 Tax=Azohydromonas caseinilytica TaxID=2728836 RepID=A0A848F7K8_9BURK|nr:M20/M25/M40 family metallo-hydrolase [Azohydromonas caseinilytica]NML14705.1 M20 family metallopeptidase [Azohydromonas caseinilytica]